MKRFIALFLTSTLIITTALAGCSATNSSNASTQAQSEATNTESASKEEITELSSESITITAKDSSDYTISSAGSFILTGQANNFTLLVEADKEDEVEIILEEANITNDNFPVIYVKSAAKCLVTSLGENNLSVSQQFASDGDTNTDAVIFSKDDLSFNGDGSLTITSSAGNGITCKDEMEINGGSYNISSALDCIEANDSISIYQGDFVLNSDKDALHCENDDALGSINIQDGSFTINAENDGIQATEKLVIDGGEFNITAAEGMEATYVQINGGSIQINASDDGINAARKSNACDVIIEINGGEITVVAGPGDTDCLDANGSIIVNGGTLDLTGNSTFDYDVEASYNGGTIIINGTTVDSIPASMMGGPGGPGGNGGAMGNIPSPMTGGPGGNGGNWPEGNRGQQL